MLLVVAALAAVGAVLVAVRWTVTRVDTLGRVRDFPVMTVVGCLALAGITGYPVLRHARFEDRLSAAASALASVQVQVDCQTLSEAWTEARPEAGYVRFGADGRPEPLATISLQTCDDLRAWIGSPQAGAPLAQIVAVHVLTHEAMHLRGISDEARTECAAVQRDARTATLLGADPVQARALSRRYWQEVYGRMPDAYRTAECRAGQPLDERLPDAPWAAPGQA